MYFYLLTILHLHFVFSGALPFDKRDTTNAGGTRLSWSEAVDGNTICKVNATLLDQDGCNTCSCTVGLPPICTLMLCYKEQLPKHPKKHCTPGTKWEEDCNKCVCTQAGFASCTLNDCSSQKRIKRYLEAVPEEKTKCKPGSKWKFDCNTCYCSEEGVPSCTLKVCIKWERITKNNGLIKELKGKLDDNGKCIGKEIWEVDCNTCFCSEEGELYCTRRHCTHRDKRASGKINPGGKCKPGERWNLDECNTCVCTHTGYASCTLNDCSSQKKRPKRNPAEQGKISPGGKCKPGERWNLDECNTCVCTHTGYASCTLNDCSSQKKRPKRNPAEQGKINPGGKCKPGDRWKLDECNTCVCTHTGYASCTLNDCSSQKKRPKRNPAELGKINPGGKCKPGDRWKLDECNTCVCTHTGYASCTLNDCSSQKKRPKRNPAEQGKINPGGKCKPGERWNLDECNTCVCTHTGYASCTLNDCSSQKKRPKRDPAEQGKISPGGKCKSGERWKLDECNTCVCTHTGYASCTLNDCSSQKKRPKRNPAELGTIPPGGKCKPGDLWKLDECNKCVCTHKGFASCSLNDCSSQKGRGKRSSDGSLSGLSDFVDEGGICKQTVEFKLDCNTCYCNTGKKYYCTKIGCHEYKNHTKRIKRDFMEVGVSGYSEYVNEKNRCKKKGVFMMDCNTCSCIHEGGHYFCTLLACPQHKNKQLKLQRITRDARVNENGNSGLECKPGVSWKENCNSCFCSERGIAMCTDIPTCPSPPPAPLKEKSPAGGAGVATTPSLISSTQNGNISSSTESTSVSSPLAVPPSQELSSTTVSSLDTTSEIKNNPTQVPLITDVTTTTELITPSQTK